MSIARHHAEWLSLIEISGPFVSMPVLLRVFPQGLDEHDPEVARDLHLAFDEWQENQLGARPNAAIHRAWIRYVLTDVLGFPDDLIVEGQSMPPGIEAHMTEHGEVIRPDLAVVNPDGRANTGKPRVLLHVYPKSQGLERQVADSGWQASPTVRMMELLRATDVPLGIVTNGEQWMLVHHGDTMTYASWYASIWVEEQITLRAFRSLLSAYRFFGVPDEDTLEGLFAESADYQHEVTIQLGHQVRKAVEVLIQAIDRIDRDRGRTLLANVDEETLYEAALTIMMRLVFLFFAEEWELLPIEDEFYNQFYAASTLREQLREVADQHGEEILERRYDAWPRLMATFRGVYGGIRHDRISSPPYGGRLFDPDRFPFLEGRARGTSWLDASSDPLRIDNRTVLHLLEALQILQVKVPGGGPAEPRRLSFKGLNIEQIGHVYEGMLDHTAVRADEPILGLAGTADKEPEIPLRELEEALSRGTDEAAKYLKKETGRSESALRRAIESPALADGRKLHIACGNDGALCDHVRRFAGLLRNDTTGYPVVIDEGSVFVTQTSTRRATGTHYTPVSLTEPIVRYALEPLVYEGPAEGKPKEEWKLKSPKQILELKVCDPAMGSGAFLVQACRYLSERLVEAWGEAEKELPADIRITPEGAPSLGQTEEQIIPKDPDERLVIARRIIADRCLYGVDKNHMAVEMAKLSLWLITMAKNKPFSFLDHALKCGDSLVGLSSMDQLQTFSLDKSGSRNVGLFIGPQVGDAVQIRKHLACLPDTDIRDIREKERLNADAEKAMERLETAGDLIVGTSFAVGNSERESKLATYQMLFAGGKKDKEVSDTVDAGLREDADGMLRGIHPFHWPLEYPEVFMENGHPGFHAIIGNPPFMGGQKITGELGTDYRNYLVEYLANGKRGSADLCSYFFLRVHDLLRDGGMFGMLATNTIAQGDTREVGLEQIAASGGTIVRAVPSQKWPGTANLEVSVVWVRHGGWGDGYVLQDRPVKGITPFLAVPGAVQGNPYRLAENTGKSFQGSNVLGMGFVLDPAEAQELIARDSKNEDVLFPYLNGEDLNSSPDQSPSRWVINFFDWPLNRCAEGSWLRVDEARRRQWLRSGLVPPDYPDPVAADFPDCLAIVHERVKPERDKLASGDATARDRARRWWQFARPTMALYAAITEMDRVLVAVQTSKYLSLSFEPTNIVYSHMTVVFAVSESSSFAVLNASWHTDWILKYCSSLETRLRYIPSDGFDTFPSPLGKENLEQVGEQYCSHRQSVMHGRQEGLTKTYNRFHNPAEVSEDIRRLRELHVEMDKAVAAAYGWTDLDLDHGFHETKQGLRFTISAPARREVLDRLLALNHERYEEEVRQGLHDKQRKKYSKSSGGRGTNSAGVNSLF